MLLRIFDEVSLVLFCAIIALLPALIVAGFEWMAIYLLFDEAVLTPVKPFVKIALILVNSLVMGGVVWVEIHRRIEEAKRKGKTEKLTANLRRMAQR
jgi:hypothetical protein